MGSNVQFFDQKRVTRFKKVSRLKSVAEKVDHPFLYGQLDIDYLRNLGKGIRSTAWLGHDMKQQRSFVSKALVAMANASAVIYTISVMILAVLMTLSLLQYVAVAVSPEGDPVWGLVGKSPPSITKMAIELVVGSISGAPVLSRIIWIVLFGTASAAGAAIIGSTFARGLDGLIEEVRRMVLILLWPLLCGVAALAIYPVRVLIIFFSVMILPVFSIFSKVLAFELGLWSSVWPAMGGAGVFLVLLLSIHLLSTRFAHQLKLLADVFLYLGNAEYREQILKGLKDSLDKNAQGTKHMVILGHSLGSVISADLLQLGIKAEKVSLVTMGSPLNRLFHRFFPSQVPSAKGRAGSLGAMYKEFRWVNVFRPLDFVGGSLAAGHNYFSEQSTKQVKDPFSSHIGYWKDEVVAKILDEKFRRFTRDRCGDGVAMSPNDEATFVKEATFSTSAELYPHHPRYSKKASLISAFVLLFILPVWHIAVEQVIEPARERRIIAQRYDYLEKYGREVRATVFASKKIEKDRSGGSTSYYPSYIVNLFWTHDGIVHKQTIRSQLIIDMKRLSERFRNGVRAEDNYYTELTVYRPFDTQVLFDPKDPSRFALPEFKTDKRVDDGLDPIMSLLSPFLGPTLVEVAVWMLFLPLIEAAAGISSVPFLSDARDEILFLVF